MSERRAAQQAFAGRIGWGAAARAPIAGDASGRTYARLSLPGRTAILMDAPPGTGDDPADFVRIGRHLARHGFSTPRILAEDLNEGFLLLEDFGDALFAALLQVSPGRSRPLYRLATEALVQLARVPLLPGLPDLSAADWARAALAHLGQYAGPGWGEDAAGRLQEALTAALCAHADGPRMFIHRDFHAENLILLPGREGIAQVGLLDFQLGQAGQPGYDLVSLLQDARRDVDARLAAEMAGHYATALRLGRGAFSASLAALGAQRALRILGVFARLAGAGKPRYLAFVPRVWGHLQVNLSHPALADLRRACAALPAPGPDLLARLAAP